MELVWEKSFGIFWSCLSLPAAALEELWDSLAASVQCNKPSLNIDLDRSWKKVRMSEVCVFVCVREWECACACVSASVPLLMMRRCCIWINLTHRIVLQRFLTYIHAAKHTFVFCASIVPSKKIHQKTFILVEFSLNSSCCLCYHRYRHTAAALYLFQLLTCLRLVLQVKKNETFCEFCIQQGEKGHTGPTVFSPGFSLNIN